MSTATVEIENNGAFTNLDILRGKVHINLKSATALSSIVVKMEGIAKSIVPVTQDDRRGKKREGKNDAIEIHKVLYKTLTVFPPKEIAQNSTSNQFTLAPGNYTYDFQFKIPIKVQCQQPNAVSGTSGLFGNIVLRSGGFDIARSASGHLDSILPPSLSGLGENATVKYFVKVTVNKASMFRMNTRANKPFVFLPMDPPIIDEGRLAFARREITTNLSNPQTTGKKKSGFGGMFSNIMGINSYEGPTMQFAFEARYPRTTAIQAVSRLPYQFFILLKKPPSGDYKVILLKDFKINLLAITDRRAQEYQTESRMVLTLCNKADINMAIPFADARESPARTSTGAPMYEIPINPALIEGVEIPDYVPPTFSTCNIGRRYTLEIEAGFQLTTAVKPEYATLSIDVIVQSGIALPQNITQSPSPSPVYANIPPPTPQRPNEKQTLDNTNGYNQVGPQSSEGQQLNMNDQLPTYEHAITPGQTGASPGYIQPPDPQAVSKESMSGSQQQTNVHHISTAPEVTGVYPQAPSSQGQSSPSYQQASSSSSNAPRLPPRRQFGQNADYYENVDNYD